MKRDEHPRRVRDCTRMLSASPGLEHPAHEARDAYGGEEQEREVL
jgi:hypothetical protein